MNVERVEAILRLLRRQGYVGEVEVEGSGWRVRAVAAPYPAGGEAGLVQAAAEAEPPTRFDVGAPMVGVYRAPNHPLVLGDFVRKGGELGSIESMRIRNPLTVAEEGYLASVLVEDGDPVEYGQALFEVAFAPLPLNDEPADS